MIDFSQSIRDILFFSDLIVHYGLLVGIVWSVAFPGKRIWPPPKKRSWQHRLTWTLFYLAFILNAALIFVDWNSWFFTDNARFTLGVPLAIIGALLVSWGITTLGGKNTSGLKDGFVSQGPYRFTRNPQYFGDMLLFAGIILISNSSYVLVTHMLLILVFALTPLSEEIWLEEMYGDEYKEYKKNTTRFL